MIIVIANTYQMSGTVLGAYIYPLPSHEVVAAISPLFTEEETAAQIN